MWYMYQLVQNDRSHRTMKTTFAAERLIPAPAHVIYNCIADYRQHHRPGGFLPPAFSHLEIHSGGVGAGTDVSWVLDAGGRQRTIRATVSEPEPGRTLVETSPGLETTFHVEPAPGGSVVSFSTVPLRASSTRVRPFSA